MTMQFRIAPEGGGVRDVDDGKRQVLFSIPFEVIDSYQTDFQRDAFDGFLANRLPVMCWQHVRSEPIGRVVAHQRSASANEFTAQFSDFDAVPRAKQAFSQLRDREITDVSFGFDQAKSIPHPSVRGAIRFTEARMPEISPVTIGAIPGAVAVGIRAEAELANVRGLLEAGAIDEESANAMLRAAGLDPLPRQRVEVSSAQIGVDGARDAVEAVLREMLGDQRSVTITIGDDGTITTEGAVASDDGDDEPSPAELASAIDGAVDAAIAIAAGLDLTALPGEVGQIVQLLHAADVAADELLEVLGLPDPDGDDEADDETVTAAREAAAALEAERAAKEPYGDVEYADPGYQKDKQKRYPIDSAAHVKAAWSYIHQEKNRAFYTAEQLTQIEGRIKAAAKKFGITVSDKRDDDGIDAMEREAEEAFTRLDGLLST